jgi:hypothetical protein
LAAAAAAAMAISIPLFSSTLSSSISSSSSLYPSKFHSPSRTSTSTTHFNLAIRSSYSGNGSSPDAFNYRFLIYPLFYNYLSYCQFFFFVTDYYVFVEMFQWK